MDTTEHALIYLENYKWMLSTIMSSQLWNAGWDMTLSMLMAWSDLSWTVNGCKWGWCLQVNKAIFDSLWLFYHTIKCWGYICFLCAKILEMLAVPASQISSKKGKYVKNLLYSTLNKLEINTRLDFALLLELTTLNKKN